MNTIISRKHLLQVLFFIFLSLPVCSFGFTGSDLEGTWHFYWMTTSSPFGGTKYPAVGEITVNSAGVVTGGSYSRLVVTSITGGGLLLGSRGGITGELYLEGGVTQTLDGWMGADKNFIYQVAAWTDNGTTHLASGLMIKETGTDFLSSDMLGTWEGVAIEARPADSVQEVYYLNSEINYTAQGYNGTWYFPYGQSGAITGSELYSDESGFLSGTLNVDIDGTAESGEISPDSSDTPTGKLAENRELAIADIYKTNGKVANMVFIKEGGSDFTGSDLKGEWAVFITEMISGTPPTGIYWITASIRLDADGTLVSGDWESFHGTTGTFLSGTVGISDTGKLSGTFTTSDNREMTIDKGCMGIARTYAACTLTKKDTGESSFDTLNSGFFVKKSENSGIIAPRNLLLLN